MKQKNIYISKLVVVVLIIITVITACTKDFLDTTNPNALTPDNFPTKLEDLELLIVDNYGRLRKGFYDAYPQARVGYGVSHYADQGYSDNDFNAGCQISFNPNLGDVRDIWTGHYENINKANATLAAIDNFRTNTANLTDDNKKTLNYREGEIRFLRAWHYYWLVNFYGESAIGSAADADKMGVPLVDKVANGLSETQIPRATLGQTWNFIISDLKKAETLLKDKTWTGSERARVGIWSVKGFLGKAYVFTQKWDSANVYLKDVIDNSSQTLVPYTTYKNMFNSNNAPNEESLFEINYNTKQLAGGWNNTTDATSYVAVLLSPVYMTPERDANANGFGNFFIHDKSLQRFGYSFGKIVNEATIKNKQGRFTTNADSLRAELGTTTDPNTYLGYSEKIRQESLVDPRLWVCGLQPHVDNLLVDGKLSVVVKNKFENGTNPKDYNSWSFRKFTVTDKSFWSLNQGVGSNVYWLRLAEVYLLYAESLAATGDNANALEYINKVHRRAFGLPVNTPSVKDYASLTANTMASDLVLKSSPLRYERFVELFGENASWWLDVRRWKIGKEEADYYQKVTSGTLSWNENKYAMPIPQTEVNANTSMKQNPGF